MLTPSDFYAPFRILLLNYNIYTRMDSVNPGVIHQLSSGSVLTSKLHSLIEKSLNSQITPSFLKINFRFHPSLLSSPFCHTSICVTPASLEMEEVLSPPVKSPLSSPPGSWHLVAHRRNTTRKGRRKKKREKRRDTSLSKLLGITIHW